MEKEKELNLFKDHQKKLIYLSKFSDEKQLIINYDKLIPLTHQIKFTLYKNILNILKMLQIIFQKCINFQKAYRLKIQQFYQQEHQILNNNKNKMIMNIKLICKYKKLHEFTDIIKAQIAIWQLINEQKEGTIEKKQTT